MNKKGQVKFGETIGIIFIVYIVLVMGFVWYNNSNSKDIQKQIEEDRMNQAFEKYNYVVKLNLIHRSELGYIDEEFDLSSIKAMGLYSATGEGKEYFRERLSNSLVTIRLYDLDKRSIENVTLYNQTPDKKHHAQNFRTIVPVIDGVSKNKYMGILEVVDFQIVN